MVEQERIDLRPYVSRGVRILMDEPFGDEGRPYIEAQEQLLYRYGMVPEWFFPNTALYLVNKCKGYDSKALFDAFLKALQECSDSSTNKAQILFDGVTLTPWCVLVYRYLPEEFTCREGNDLYTFTSGRLTSRFDKSAVGSWTVNLYNDLQGLFVVKVDRPDGKFIRIPVPENNVMSVLEKGELPAP